MNEVNTQATQAVETPAPVAAQAPVEVELTVESKPSTKSDDKRGNRYNDENFETLFANFEAASMTESKYIASVKGTKDAPTSSALRSAVLYGKGLLINEPVARYRRDRKETVSQYFADLEVDLNQPLATIGNDITQDSGILLKSAVVQELAKELVLHTPFLDLLKYAGIDPETSSMSDLANKLFTAKFTKKS